MMKSVCLAILLLVAGAVLSASASAGGPAPELVTVIVGSEISAVIGEFTGAIQPRKEDRLMDFALPDDKRPYYRIWFSFREPQDGPRERAYFYFDGDFDALRSERTRVRDGLSFTTRCAPQKAEPERFTEVTFECEVDLTTKIARTVIVVWSVDDSPRGLTLGALELTKELSEEELSTLQQLVAKPDTPARPPKPEPNKSE